MKNTCDISQTILDYISTEEFGVTCCQDDYLRCIAEAYKGRVTCTPLFCDYSKQPCDTLQLTTCNISYTVGVEISEVLCPGYTITLTVDNLTGANGKVDYAWFPKDDDGVNWVGTSTTDTIVMTVVTPFENWSDLMQVIVTDNEGCQLSIITLVEWTAIPCEVCAYPNNYITNSTFIFPTAYKAAFTN